MASPTASDSGSFRDLAAIVASLTLVQAAAAGIGLVVPLLLRAAGASSLVVGLVTACYMAGFLIGARLAPARIGLIGHIRAFVMFAALAGFAALIFHASGGALWLALVELLLGMAVAGLYATGESWIADAAPASGRGRIIGLYYLIAKLGVMAGPFLVAASAPGAPSAFMTVAALFCLAILPVAATSRLEPQAPSSAPFGVGDLWRAAPASVQAALVAGAVNGAVLQLYPVYMAGMAAGGVAAIAAFNAAVQGGALAVQWPAGLYSDRTDRRLVIALLALLGAAASLVLLLFGEMLPLALLIAVGALWGGGSLTFYGLAVAHAADRAPEGQAANAIAGLLMVWGSGAVAGPVVAGALMTTPLGPSALFAMAAALLALLALAMVYRRATAGPIAAAEKEPFAPVSATSVGIAELDPRGYEE